MRRPRRLFPGAECFLDGSEDTLEFGERGLGSNDDLELWFVLLAVLAADAAERFEEGGEIVIKGGRSFGKGISLLLSDDGAMLFEDGGVEAPCFSHRLCPDYGSESQKERGCPESDCIPRGLFQHREDDPAERGENGREDEAPDDAAAAGEEATQLSSQIEIAQRFGGGFLDFLAFVRTFGPAEARKMRRQAALAGGLGGAGAKLSLVTGGVGGGGARLVQR